MLPLQLTFPCYSKCRYGIAYSHAKNTYSCVSSDPDLGTHLAGYAYIRNVEAGAAGS
jgi:hypothetical protein